MKRIIHLLVAAVLATDSSAVLNANDILKSTGVTGGLVVHVGCGDGALTVELCAGEGYLVQGLDTAAANVAKTRAQIDAKGLYGRVTVRRFDGITLPYIDNTVNLVLAEDLGGVALAEVMRVLKPGGIACLKQGDGWTQNVKPTPKDIDEWTHYMYDATNNAVSADKAIGPPRRHQWIGDPKWSRSHEHMSSMNAMVSAGGRLFYIIDEGSRASITLPAKWTLVARDAYNGVILWKRVLPSWYTHLWPLKSGPVQLPRRLVAIGDRVYLPLGLGEPLSALDAATGKILQTFPETKNLEEVIISNGKIYVLTGTASIEQQQYRHRTPDVWEAGDEAKLKYAWKDRARGIVAIDRNSGALLWKHNYPVVQLTPAVDENLFYFYDGKQVVALNKDTGLERWRSEEVGTNTYELGTAYAPTLVAYMDVVLYSGGLRKMTAFSKKSGETLWAEEHAESGHHSPEDLLCIDGLVWSGAIARIRQQGGTFVGRNPNTGAVESEFPLDHDVHWFHHRCHRSKAADGYILSGGTGTEFVDVRNKEWTIHHWARGACLYGVMPANGMLYVPPSPCACYMESKIHGMNALASAPVDPQAKPAISPKKRLEKGPAYGRSLRVSQGGQDWPMYRHDPTRSGAITVKIPQRIEPAWTTKLGGKLTPPIAAGGQVFTASVDTHAVYALDQKTGKENWRHSTSGRIDSPPAFWKGRIYFGSADGSVYCLDADDGRLVWRFQAAPDTRQLVVRQQLESVWPVHGSVLIENDTLYCLAGRSIFLDGGIHFYQINPKTGELLLERVWDDRVPDTGENMQNLIQGLAMPVALTDLLSSDGEHLYLRSQQVDKDGTRNLEKVTLKEDLSKRSHLFATAGFLDDSWFHRTMWIYGHESGNGWGGWSKPGLVAPIGRILSVSGDRVFGFGRRPAFFSQSSIMEYQLYSASPQFDEEHFRSTRKVTKESGYLIDNWQNNNRLPAESLTLLKYNWREEDLPLLGRALVLAGDTLIVAGPPDIVDEIDAWGRFEEKGFQSRFQAQEAALKGERGGRMWAVSAENGERQAEYRLESPPVFDGMAVAAGQLFMTTMDGRVHCWK